MIIILGLVILLAAVIVGLAGIFTNSGSTHVLTHDFAVFGYHVTGSTGTLFLYGIVVGAIGLLGLGLLLAGAGAHPGAAAWPGGGSSSPAARPPRPARSATPSSTSVRPHARTRRASPATGRARARPLRMPPPTHRRQRNRPRSAAGHEHHQQITEARSGSPPGRPDGATLKGVIHVYRIRNDYSHRRHCACRAVHAKALNSLTGRDRDESAFPVVSRAKSWSVNCSAKIRPDGGIT